MPPDSPLTFSTPPVRRLRRALQDQGLWTPAQVATRRWATGCVSLEVTQRCNLDCTLCYLSEHSEAMRDPPLAELLARVDAIADTFGPGTDVQISGGDPTLRPLADLAAIAGHIRARGMRSSLFTNGILATRELLRTLAEAGLTDVAFHVDLTQQRKGFHSEAALNALRAEYLARARGLGLQVFFNTTVFAGNLDEIPALVAFFADHADVVRVASFQIGADTGRGVHGRDAVVTRRSVIERIRRGAGAELRFDTLLAGHPDCNSVAMALVAGGRCADLLEDAWLAREALARTAHLEAVRSRPWRTAARFGASLLRHVRLWPRGVAWMARTAWRLRGVVVAPGRPVGKLTFFLHGFMDAGDLQRERIEACVFMAATPQGFMSMCEFNARRDEILLPARRVPGGDHFDPVAGRVRGPGPLAEHVYPIRFLRGRPRARALAERRAAENQAAS